MSRGFGVVCRAILEEIEEHQDDTSLSEEQIRWNLLDRIEGWKSKNPRQDLTRNKKQSITRAISTLSESESPRITTETRKLQSIDEVLIHYPHKTDDAWVRDMRIDLLPLLLTEENITSGYSTTDFENLLFRELKYRQTVSKLYPLWPPIEKQLIHLLPQFEPSLQKVVFNLLVAGKMRFSNEAVTSHGGFVDLADAVNKSYCLPDELHERIQELRLKVLPPDQESYLQLKSKLYKFTYFEKGGSRAHPFSVHYLYTNHQDALGRHDPELVRKLQPVYEKHFARKSHKWGDLNWNRVNNESLIESEDRFGRKDYLDISKEIKDAKINRLLDMRVLHEFTFLDVPR